MKCYKLPEPAGMENGLGCVGEQNINPVVSNISNLEIVFRRENMINAEKKRMINQLKPKKPPIVCSYCMFIGHFWHQFYRSKYLR